MDERYKGKMIGRERWGQERGRESFTHKCIPCISYEFNKEALQILFAISDSQCTFPCPYKSY